MPELRDLLRSAAPVPGSELDLNRLWRRAAQRRRRVALVVGASLALVMTAAVSTVLTSVGDPERESVQAVDQPSVVADGALMSVDAVRIRGLAVSANALWAVRQQNVEEGRTVRPTWALERRDPSTGQMVATIPMPGVVHGVVAADDLVAAFGGGDGAYPQGGVALVDAARNQVIASYGWDAGPAVSPQRAVATPGAIWMTDASGRLLRFSRDLTGAPLQSTWDLDGRPTDIVALDDGSIWVLRSQKRILSRIDPASGIVTESHPWCCRIFAGDGERIWTTDGEQLIALIPGLLADGRADAEHSRLPVDAAVVVVDGDGLWVGTEGDVLQRWSRQDFTASRPQPIAAIETDRVLAPWGLAGADGAAWFVTDRGFARWRLAEETTPSMRETEARATEAEVRAFLDDLRRGDLDSAQARLSTLAPRPAADLATDPVLMRLAASGELVVTVTPSWSFTDPAPVVTASTGTDADGGLVAAAFLVDASQPLGAGGGPIHRVQTVGDTPEIDTAVAPGEQIVIPSVPVEGGGRAFLGDLEVALDVNHEALEMRVTYPPGTTARILTISVATPELPTATAFVLDVMG